MVVLMLGEAGDRVAGPVCEPRRLLQHDGDPHLFPQPTLCGREHRLTGAGMSTTRVGPETSEGPLRRRATLEERLAPAVEHEDGERSMQQAVLMSAEDILVADVDASLAYQDDPLGGRRGRGSHARRECSSIIRR